MMELALAVVVISLAAVGLGLGLILGRGPARTSCGAADNLTAGKCADCPLRQRGKG
jgi:hypothetical protein